MNTQQITPKLCECGCGQPTNLARCTDPVKGWIKGEPLRYLYGHRGQQNSPQDPPNPSGFCECGCGELTPVAIRSNAKLGHVKGQPVRFVIGHHVRLRPMRPTEVRFWEKLDKRGPDECWEWQGSKQPYGYGELRVDGRNMRAHRYSYQLHNGPIPDDLDCLHKCDNPPCCNPNHLFLGTAKDNAQDMLKKGRGSKPPVHHGKGGNSTAGIFTNAQARQFRDEFAVSDMTMAAFARLHGVADETMREILKYKTYQNA